MSRFESHGRLGFLKIFCLISLLSAFTLILGATLAFEWNQRQLLVQEKMQLDQARVQNQLLSQSFWMALEKLKLETANFNSLNQNPGPVLFPESILHWSQLEMREGLLPALMKSVRNPQWPFPSARMGIDGSGFEENYLQSATHALSEPGAGAELARGEVKVIEVREDRDLKPRYLAFAFKSQQKGTRVGTDRVGLVDLILVDPVPSFPIFKQFSKAVHEGSYRAYLLSSEGVVLVHSNASYLNSDFGSLPIFKKGIHELQSRIPAGMPEAATLKAADHLQALSSYSQLGNLPLYAVIEKVRSNSGPELSQFWGALKNHLTEALLFSIAWLVSTAALAFWISRQISSNLVAWVGGKAGGGIEVELDLQQLECVEQPVAPSKVRQSLKNEIKSEVQVEVKAVSPQNDADLYRFIQQAATDREKLAGEMKNQKQSEEQLLLDRFEADAARLRVTGDFKVVSEKLTSVASKICRSPTLYFTYQESTRLAILSSDAGFSLTQSLGEAPSTLTFPVTADALDQMIQGDRLGEWISLSEYRPLGRAILSKLGIAHFEAWAIMSQSGGQSRLKGVLVVLQSGVDSNFHHDSLGRMVRAAGLGYTGTHEAPESALGQKSRQAQENSKPFS